jgi:hypothetical protein
VHATVPAAVGPSREANLADRPEPLDEGRDTVGRSFSVRDQIEHRVLGLAEQARRILRVGHHEPARSAERRLVVADRALIAVETRAQARRVRASHQVRLCGIGVRAEPAIRAVIADRFELNCPLEPLREQRELDRGQPGEWRSCAWRSAAHPGIMLSEAHRGHENDGDQRRAMPDPVTS